MGFSLYPNNGRPTFHLDLEGGPKRRTFSNLSSFILHSNLSLIIARESGIVPNLLYSQVLEIWSVSRVPKTIRKQFLQKTYSLQKTSKGQNACTSGFISLFYLKKKSFFSTIFNRFLTYFFNAPKPNLKNFI